MCEVGEVFTGFCEGFFGRDSYGDKRVEAYGADWIVCREIDNNIVLIATFDSREEKDAAVERWRKTQ